MIQLKLHLGFIETYSKRFKICGKRLTIWLNKYNVGFTYSLIRSTSVVQVTREFLLTFKLPALQQRS